MAEFGKTDTKAADEKKDHKEEKEQKAVSLMTGGEVKLVTPPAGFDAEISSTYVGVGPLLIPCSRGEQKAQSGDVVVQFFAPDPNDPINDKVFTIIVPAELVDALLPGASQQSGATQKEYQELMDKMAKRHEKKAAPSPAATTQTRSTR